MSVVILAAGAGTRMKSSLPKPLHPVGGRPMLAHVLDVALALDPIDVTIVGSPELAASLREQSWVKAANIVVQESPMGTADALRVAFDSRPAGRTVLVVYADHPLVTTPVLRDFLDPFDPAVQRVAVMTCVVDDAAGYGRIQRDEHARVARIIERVDDDVSLRMGPTEINSGVMAIDASWVPEALSRLRPNARKNEYFLTDLVEMAAIEDAGSVTSAKGSPEVLVGVNDRAELAVADSRLRERKRAELLANGVTMIAPETNLIDLDVEVGSDTTIGPYCIIEAGTRIGADCRIGPNAVVRACVIANGVRIESSTVEDSSIGRDSDVGPYSHIRGGSDVGQRVHIGNFAELKNARLGDDVRVGHFSYIGDAGLGADVNIGAGTITCNFDGVNKHRTEIGEGAFIGSDTMLIAPVSIGARARTGAGSVVTRDVAADATVVGMPARSIRGKPTEGRPASSEGEA